MTSEISPSKFIDTLHEEDHLVICAVTHEEDSETMILQRGNFVKCFKELYRRLLCELEQECDYDYPQALKIADDICEEVSCDWLSEISPNHAEKYFKGFKQ